jgi:hypothetical protein
MPHAMVITMPKFPIVRAFSFALLIVVSCLVGTAAAQVGQVGAANGTIELSRAGQIRDLAVAMPILLNDQITTGPASSATINLNGGSELELGESTTLKIDQHVLPPTRSNFTTRINLLIGTVRSLVPAVVAGTADFEVHTPNAVTAVRGTDYRAAYSLGQKRFGYPGCASFTDVSVATGVVAVANVANPSATVDVPAGFTTTVACDQGPQAPGPSDVSESGSEGVGAGVNVPPPPAAPAPAPPAPAPPPGQP